MFESAEQITGNDYRRMIVGAYRTFMMEHQYIDSLNVFPVPDGDTGTNMLLTIGAVSQTVLDAPDSGIGSLSKRAADSAIMGARGNSGVILSQIFRGIARGLAGKEQATTAEVAKAFQYGVLYAYRAVARPVEGTILTVAKGIAKGARRAVREGLPFADILSEAIAAGQAELARTPEMLPILKSAGVVDAGGQGLIVFLQGCLAGLEGEGLGPEASFGQGLMLELNGDVIDQPHPYCTEFVVKGCMVSSKEAKETLLLIGESLVLAASDDLLKVHIHTAHPGAVLEAAITWGSLHDIKIDNMADQHRNFRRSSSDKAGLAVISVAAGDGLAAIMRKLGAVVISGGATMNPPVEDFVAAVHRGNAERYIILPNNKNIVLAAAQAQKLLAEKVAIIPTVNIPQGLAALLAFDPGVDLAANIGLMTDRAAKLRAAAVTVAVRASMLDGRVVPAGAFIGVLEGEVVTAGDTLAVVLKQVVQLLATADRDVISLYYGETIPAEEANQLSREIALQMPELEIELYAGGQPNYQFILSAE